MERVERREEYSGADLGGWFERIPRQMEREVIPLINKEFAKLREDLQERDRTALKEVARLREELEELEAERVKQKLKLERVKEYA